MNPLIKKTGFWVRERSKWIDLAISCRTVVVRGHHVGWRAVSGRKWFFGTHGNPWISRNEAWELKSMEILRFSSIFIDFYGFSLILKVFWTRGLGSLWQPDRGGVDPPKKNCSIDVSEIEDLMIRWSSLEAWSQLGRTMMMRMGWEWWSGGWWVIGMVIRRLMGDRYWYNQFPHAQALESSADIAPYIEPPISPSTIMDSITVGRATAVEAAEGRPHIGGWRDWWFHIWYKISCHTWLPKRFRNW